MNYPRAAQVLAAVGMAEADRQPFGEDEIAELARESELPIANIRIASRWVDAKGLAEIANSGSRVPPRLTNAGRQYLWRRGQVDTAVLSFLPRVIDNLDARSALIEAGARTVQGFRDAVLAGEAVGYACELVPNAFRVALTEDLALDLYAAAVALSVRLAEGAGPACVAEELVAIRLISEAHDVLRRRELQGDLAQQEAGDASAALHGIFALFEDDDVLLLFEAKEPADAALLDHLRLRAAMVPMDRRLEAWFRPYDGRAPTGHLAEPSDRTEQRPGDLLP